MIEKTLINVGAGVAGASTALAAVDVFDELYLIDDPSPTLIPASQGLERIVWASYPQNKVYERLALQKLEAYREWTSGRILSQIQATFTSTWWYGFCTEDLS